MISQIGKYTIEAELGAGGFGRVYKAWDPDVRQSVAIKVLLSDGDPELLKRFRQEVVTTASLHHKNIVTIYASGEENGTPYLVMELLEGQTLGQIIKQQIPLTLMEKVRIMTQVAEGLAYAHGKGVVHRDIKPANIMLQPDGSAKIMDFGIALASDRRTMNMTMQGYVLGTVPYMSPEQFTGDNKASEQTDIFSFGDVYYELLTGHHPFSAFMRDMSSLHVAMLTHDPQPVSQLVPECPDALELVVHRTLAKEREFRYQTFEEVRLDSASVLVDLQHEQAAAILRGVPRLLAIAELQEARAKVREAQKLDPGNRQARQLLETIDQQLQEKQNRQRIAARLLEAERAISERRFTEAVQSLETAAKLDTTDVAIQIRLADAKAKLDGAAEANRLMEDARSRQQRGGFAEALERLERAIQIDPEHTAARRLHGKLSDQIVKQQREQARRQALESATEQIARKNFAEAQATLDELERQQPGDPEVADLRGDLERQRAAEERRIRAERFQKALAKTRDTMQAGDLDRARQMLDHLTTNFASDPGVPEVLATLRERLEGLVRGREISTCRQQVTDLLQRKAFREASDLLTSALRKFPDDPGLMRQKGSLDAQLEADRYAAGLESLLATLRAMLQAGQYREAIEQGARAGEYSREPEVRALLDAVRAAAEEQAEQRAVADALAAAEQLRGRHDAEGALRTIEEARRRYPRNSVLSERVEQLRSELETVRRSAAIEKHRSAITRALEAGAWQQADAAVRRARAEFPDDGTLRLLDERVQAGLQEVALAEAAQRIRVELAASNLPEAMRHLEATRSVFVRDPRWKAIEEEVERQRGYESALAEAERQRASGRMDEAAAQLTRLVASAPDGRAAQMLQAIERDREVARKQVAYEAALVEAERQRAAGRTDEAVSRLTRLVASAPDGRATQMLQAIERDRDAERQRAYEAVLAEAERQRAAGRTDEAVAQLTGIIPSALDGRATQMFQAIEHDREAARKQAAETERQRAYESALAEAERQRAAGRTDEAVSQLTRLVASAPDGRAAQMLQAIERDRAAKRQQEYEAALSEAEQHRGAGRTDEAARILAGIVGSAPDGRAKQMLQTIERDVAEAAKQAAIASAAQSVRECLTRGELDRTGELLRAARKSHPNASAWAELDRELESARKAAKVVRQAPVEPRRVEVVEAPAKKSFPWVLAGAGAAVLVAAGVVGPPLMQKTPAPVPVPVTTVPVEIRTDPSGVGIQLGDRSCETPNCKLELKPGSYQLQARLKDYLPKTQTVVVDRSTSVIELTLSPLPVATPDPKEAKVTAATGTLVVRAGVPDALVYVDGKARNRTDRSGSLSIPLEAKAHEVRVERNGYDSPGSQKVTIVAGNQQVAVFRMTAAKVTKPTDSVVTPPPPTTPTPEMLERQQWDRLRMASDIDQLQAFLRTYPNGAHAKDAESRISDLQWAGVDQNNVESVRKFLRDAPVNSHRGEAQNIVNQFDERARQEQAKLEAAKKQEAARLETVRLGQVHAAYEAASRLDVALQNRKPRDIKAAWPGVSNAFLQAVQLPGVKFSLHVREEEVHLRQDGATVLGSLIRNLNGTEKTQRAFLTLRNSGGAWIVESATFE